MPEFPSYNNSGVLRRGKKVKTHEKDPDFVGMCKVNGENFWIQAWIRETEKGRKYFRLFFRRRNAPETHLADSEIENRMWKEWNWKKDAETS